ncbi:MAG: 2-hydroxyacid dehydrogenase [Mariprofundaceae bacterium]|nr:2-hydroxyacid dehydrogenase [Mariprofundaceae bacterium]
MKVTIYSSQPYDKKYFIAANENFGHQLIFHEARLEPKTVELARGSDAVCAFVNDDLSEITIEALKAIGVPMIALRCAGYNNVDLRTADKLGIHVVRVPSYSPYAVAEHTIALMLSLNRKIHRAYSRVRDGNFSLQGLTGFDMHGKTVGIIGTGRIGSIVANILQGFGCKVLAFDTFENEALKKNGVQYLPLNKLLAQVDIISFHCPLTPETFHLINEESLALMKDGVMIINTSRGAIVDASEAIKGLKSGKISHLGLDVYEQEGDLFFHDLSETIIRDDVFERLLTFPNVLVTGHQGFFTEEALVNIAHTTLENIACYGDKKPLQNTLHLDQAIAG